jgi:hypothetical protein
MKDKLLNYKMLLSFMAADIDIYLIEEHPEHIERESNPDVKCISPNELREQLHKTIKKAINVLNQNGFDTDKPLLQDKFVLLNTELKEEVQKQSLVIQFGDTQKTKIDTSELDDELKWLLT